jgi:hypothetical protein
MGGCSKFFWTELNEEWRLLLLSSGKTRERNGPGNLNSLLGEFSAQGGHDMPNREGTKDEQVTPAEPICQSPPHCSLCLSQILDEITLVTVLHFHPSYHEPVLSVEHYGLSEYLRGQRVAFRQQLSIDGRGVTAPHRPTELSCMLAHFHLDLRYFSRLYRSIGATIASG